MNPYLDYDQKGQQIKEKKKGFFSRAIAQVLKKNDKKRNSKVSSRDSIYSQDHEAFISKEQLLNESDRSQSIIEENEEDLVTNNSREDEKSKNGIQVRLPWCYKPRKYLGLTHSREIRTLHLTGKRSPNSYCSNKINNQKYNILTFVPLCLINQFKFFFNFFFLLMILTQFVPAFKVGFLITFLIPLFMVLTFTFIKEGWDDIQRFLKDRKLNNTKYVKINDKGDLVQTTCQNLRVGDIIKVNHNDRFPADLIVLYTSDKQGGIFIKTDQLDGETDWKFREAIYHTQKMSDAKLYRKSEMKITANPPEREIYDFKGYYQIDQDTAIEGLSLKNTVWANCIMASQGFIYGMVVYTGNETRYKMNSQAPSSKVGKTDLEINHLTKFLFVLMLVVALIVCSFTGFRGHWYVLYFRYILLLAMMLPQSLRTNLDMGKIYYSYLIKSDKQIPGTIPRNSTMPEELGRIQFLLTDKTGTLTKNDMTLKKIAMEYAQFDDTSGDDLKQLLAQNCASFDYPCSDVNPALNFESNQQLFSTSINSPTQAAELETQINMSFIERKSTTSRRNTSSRREQASIVRDFITALAVCHNVTPVFPDPDKPDYKEFQASSPDEVALVKYADSLGMRLVHRDQQNSIKLINAVDNEENYEIQTIFPFTSESKRMGIVVRNQKSGKLIFYLKGAENVIIPRLKPYYRTSVDEKCEYLAMDGLRTLVVTQKILDEQEFKKWLIRYKQAQADLNDRQEKTLKVIEELENDMDLLGITGVEDKLQDEVSSTIEKLRSAGMKVWMLTGDKIETAQCIAISAGFKHRNQRLFVIRDQDNENQMKLLLEDFERVASKSVLIIDGSSLSNTVFHKDELEEKFFNVACLAPSVCVCRCSPQDKAYLVKCIGKYTKFRTAAVGDGGNDVSMIRESNIGIGIEGKEGNQASLAADYSITQFSHLKRLILWHGRNSYNKSSIVALYNMHRGLILAIIQAFFCIVYYGVTIPVFNSMLQLGYTSIYNNISLFALFIDEDVTPEVAIEYPALYKTLQKGRNLGLKQFLYWVWISIFQGAVILLGTVGMFDQDYTTMITITFSCLVYVEVLIIHSSMTRNNWMICAAGIFTITIYITTVCLYPSLMDASKVSWVVVFKILAIITISWAPLYILKKFQERFYPADHQKIMMQFRNFI
eukprot:403344250